MKSLTNWFRTLVRPMLVFWLIFNFGVLQAQTNRPITLKDAFVLAEKNYPNFSQKQLLQQSYELTAQNIQTGYLPQINLTGQATYQSDVTQVKIPLPGITIPSQSKDQYKLVADVSQLIFDGGVIKQQKNIQQLATRVEDSKLNVELYNLKNQVFQLYFSILLQQDLLEQVNLLQKDIQVGINKMKPRVENGVALRSNLLVLQAQQLKTSQQAIEIENNKKGLMDALGVFLNILIDQNTLLLKDEAMVTKDSAMARPELFLFDQQINLLQSQKSLIEARNLPKVSAFVQGGVGRPGLNLLSNEFAGFYIGGVRLNWSLSNLYNAKRDKQLLDISHQTVDLQKETFIHNIQSQLRRQLADISKFAELVESDNAIIELRKSISDAAKAQLDNAVITSNDYITEINAESQARQAMVIHQIQLLQAKVNYAITSGTF